MNPRLHICTSLFYHWTTSHYSSALLKYFLQPAI